MKDLLKIKNNKTTSMKFESNDNVLSYIFSNFLLIFRNKQVNKGKLYQITRQLKIVEES